MRLWILTYNPPAAAIVVWADDADEARRLAIAKLADKAPGITPTETAAVPSTQPSTSEVVFCSITEVS